MIETAVSLGMAFGYVAVPCLVVLMILPLVERAMGIAIIEDDGDWVTVCFFGLTMLPLGVTYLRDRHVRVDVVRDRLSPRATALIEVAGCLLVMLPVGILLIWAGTDSTLRAFHFYERLSEDGHLAIKWVVQSFVPLGFGLLVLAVFRVVGGNILFLLARAEQPQPTACERD